jgi:hypothetical protein
MKKHPPENVHELRVCTEMRAFARLILPIYEAEYESQLTSPAPCWMFLSILERRMRELEQQAK